MIITIKNNIHFFLFALALIMSVPSLFAQSPNDALRYSQTTFGGTARSMGVAGAFGALGGDFSATSNNPAGLGIYQKSEIVFTPSLFLSNTESTYFDKTTTDQRSNFNFNNFGVVFTNKARERRGKTSNWRTTTLAFGMNRLANFNSRTYMSGYNTNNSISQYYAERANGTTAAALRDELPFDAGLAYWVYAINPTNTAETEYAAIAEGNVEQEEFGNFQRGIDEYTLSFGSNYKDKLYLGATLGIDNVRYRSEKTFRETDTENNTVDFNYFDVEDFLTVSGLGVNGKLGMIYRATNFLRVGVAAHTPTSIALQEKYSTLMRSEFESFTPDEASSPNGEYEYNVTTPWRLVGSAAFLHKFGFISIDYEFVDYSQMQFSFGDSAEERSFASDLNSTIRSANKAASNIRIGSELALDKFRARLGYAFYGSPYVDVENASRQSITGGLGIREQGFFLDVAYVHSLQNSTNQPYQLSNETVESAVVDTKNGNVVLSVGFKF
ncbi:MAG: OmpP1/FadL family transporter [Chitinophagales bacterium]